MTRWWVVVNPAAERPAAATAALRSSEIDHTLRVSPSPAAVADLIAEGVADGYTEFVAVGGDGTAHRVLNALMGHEWETPPTLGILSTSSDFIRTFALPRSLDGAAAHLIDDQRYPTDVGRIEGDSISRYFLNAVNVGVAGQSAAIATRLPRWLGSLDSAAAFWMAVGGSRHANVRVTADGRKLEGSLMNVTIANGQFIGGGLNIAPRATVQDGVFDVQLFSGPRRETPLLMSRLRRGTHLSLRSVRRTRGAEISIQCPDSWSIEADGEPIGHGPITVCVLPHAILFKI